MDPPGKSRVKSIVVSDSKAVGVAPIPGQAPENKVKDAFGNMVTDKASNKPYLA